MVRLEPMARAEFDPFLEHLLRSYAADHVRGGRWSADEAPEKARAEVGHLLPEGLATPNHYFFTIVADPGAEKVGVVWLAIEPRGAFVYDLEVHPEHRRRGYAEAAMRAAEVVAREKGSARIALHVFAENAAARRLYTKLGYSETNVVMAKPIGP
jgi:ribosomal protein S18 acetylase RimI-like enzyme